MAEATPALPTWEELAEQIPPALEKSGNIKLKLLASCWNAELVAEALKNAIQGLVKLDNLLLGGVFPVEMPPSFCADLRQADNLMTSSRKRNPSIFWSCDLVPGALELPLAAQRAAKGKVDGILAIGVVIRGDTEHFNLVSRECSAGLSQVALHSGVPVISGLLAVENEQQAKERVGQADAWARSLIQMILLLKRPIHPSRPSDS